MTKHEILKQYFGHSEFREGQEELIDNILRGRDVLGIMPTGAGKSMCYQVPAMLMDGVTIVISPLISLMKDQVGALIESGVPCAYINSSLSFGQLSEVFRRANNNMYKLIYVAPERLMTDSFISFAENTKISMVTVDESHCVSQWGQDFRPSYLKIVDFIKTLSYRPIISAFTATATETVSQDISDILELEEPFKLVTGFDRKNLYFEVINPRPSKKFETLIDVLNRDINRDKSGIIYCLSRKSVEEVCEELNMRSITATRYHAGLSPEERQENQDDFLYDRKRVMVATNAFGMGIDKSNVSFVVHYNMPKNIESYYQEAGRAGRDGELAQCTVLYTPSDYRVNKFLIDNSDENEELSGEVRDQIREQDLERLKMMTYYCKTKDCLRGFILKYFGEKVPSNCDYCSNCNTNFEIVDVTVEAQKILSCVYRVLRRGKSFGKVMIANVLSGSKDERVLQHNLDTLPTYGIMTDSTTMRIRNIIDCLIEDEYLSVDEENFNVIRPTEKANDVLYSKKKISAKLKKEIVPKTFGIRNKDIDTELFTRLKNVRKKLANRQSVPAFVVFSDASLRNMCELLPVKENEFLNVSGVGEAKLKKYGKEFIAEISAYIDEKD